LLVGGSSRIPLVGEMVNSDLGRPIALDTHPKHAVALGAAITAAPEPVPITAPVPTFLPPPAPLPPPLLASPPPPSSPVAAPRKGLSPALIALIVAGVLAFGGIGYAVTQSGGSSTTTTTTDSSSTSDSDSSTDSDSSSSGEFALTDDDAKFAAEHIVFTLFSFAPDDVESVQSSMQELTTGSLNDQVSSDNSSFVSSVQSNQTFSLPTVGDSTVRSNDGFTAAVLVKVEVDVEDLEGNSSSELRDLAFLVILENVDGAFLASELVDCSDGSSSSATGFSELGSDASC
jgi:hypothetical protein